MEPTEIPRVNVLGVGISAIHMEQVADLFSQAIESGKRNYVCVTGVHGIMEAQRDPGLRRALNSSFLSTPDGMPTVWIGKLRGFSGMGRVFGPDLMLKVCEMSQSRGYTHFLYGGNPGVGENLSRALIERFPNLKIVGTYTPPFRPLTPAEEEDLAATIGALRPDVLWVGLSTPKQERFMKEHVGKLDAKVMVGVGAAFDFLTGAIQDAPPWVKNAGLQWLHRLMQEPGRLWKRYLLANPQFVWNAALQLAGLRRYSLEV
jgi:N-acetylglucosaminyldiphosphoundecaprenol N-acetyl-beta-D-mannosaminyltransferase